MRLLSFGAALAAGVLLAACTPPATTQSGADPMGPMPVVAGFYDSGPLRADAQWNGVWFTQELANAIEANAEGPEPDRLDFDFRSWASDPEVEDIRYAVSENPESDADIVTRFSQEGLPGSMHLTWHMCLRDDSQWRIEDITAVDVQDEPALGAGEAVTLRGLLGLEAASDTCT